MTELDLDPQLEALVRQTLTGIAATSHIVDQPEHRSVTSPRWLAVATVLLVLVGLTATALITRPDEEGALGGPAPGWYEWLSSYLPDGFEHVAILDSNATYVRFEAINDASATLLAMSVSRTAIEPDPNGSITPAELDTDANDIGDELDVSLSDGRQIGISCSVLTPDGDRACSDLDRSLEDSDMRSLAQRLASLPLSALPEPDDRSPILDRLSLAVSTANDVTGLLATEGSEATPFMFVHIGDESDPRQMLIRAVYGYFPTFGSDQFTPQQTTFGDFATTWSTMPDGSVWTISSRSPVEPSTAEEVLSRIASKLDEGSVPTYPTTDPTTPPTDEVTPFSSAPISSFEQIGSGETLTILDSDDASIVARHAADTTAPYCLDLQLGRSTGPECFDRASASDGYTAFTLPSHDGSNQLIGQIVTDEVTSITTSDGRTISPESNVWWDITSTESHITYIVHASDGRVTEPMHHSAHSAHSYIND